MEEPGEFEPVRSTGPSLYSCNVKRRRCEDRTPVRAQLAFERSIPGKVQQRNHETKENGRRRKGFFRLSFLVLFFRRCSRTFAREEEPWKRVRVSAIAEGGWPVSCACDGDIYGPIESAPVRRRREREEA